MNKNLQEKDVLEFCKEAKTLYKRYKILLNSSDASEEFKERENMLKRNVKNNDIRYN